MSQKINVGSREQQSIIDDLMGKKLYQDCRSEILLIMATDCYARAKNDLVGILLEYPGLNNSYSIANTLDNLVQEGYIQVETKQGIEIYLMGRKGFEKYLKLFDNDLKQKIMVCRDLCQSSNWVKLYGLLTGGTSEGELYSTFIKRIKDAQSEILMPMLNTDPHEATIKELKSAAERGVSIYLLFADYNKVVSKLRNKKDNNAEKWFNHFCDNKNVHIRIYTRLEDAILTSSIIIDGKITRLCIHDPMAERSSAGIIIEAYKKNYNLNITELVRDRFFDIWKRSYDFNRSRVVGFFLSIDTLLIIFAVIVLIVCLNKNFNVTIDSISINFIVLVVTYSITKYYKYIYYKINRIIEKIRG